MSKTTPAKRQAYINRHRGRPCAVHACRGERRSISRYCDRHARLKYLYGHHDGHALKPSLLKPYKELANNFIDQHANTPQISTAIGVLSDLLTFGVADPSGNKELVRLRSDGVQGREMLQAVLAVWLCSHYEARALPNDDRLTYQLAIHVFKLRPAPVSVSRGGHLKWKASNGKARKVVGSAIRTRLIPFFVRVVEAMASQHAKRQSDYDALSQPFHTNSTVH